jgi:hypothetical protein
MVLLFGLRSAPSGLTYQHLAYRVLLFLAFARTTEAAFSISIPASIPDLEWVGNSKLDYQKPHDDYAEALICYYIPVGVLGFYLWFVTFIVTILSILQRFKQRTPTAIINGLFHIVFHSLQIYQNTLTVMTCPRVGRIHVFAIIGLVAAGLAVAASFLMLWGASACGVAVGFFTASLLTRTHLASASIIRASQASTSWTG